MAALRCRGAGRPGRRLPHRRGREGAARLPGARRRGAGRRARVDARRPRRRNARRRAGAGPARGRADARAPRLPDLHLRLDRRAQRHRHQPRQHLPLPEVGERPLRDARRRRGLPGRLGGVRPLDGGDLGPVPRGRDPVRRESRHDGRPGIAPRHPGGRGHHGARHRPDAAGDDLRRPAAGPPRPARRRGAARAADRPLGDGRAPAVQHLRAHGGHRGGDRGRDAPRRAGDDRRPDPELLRLRRRRGPFPARPRPAGRAADRRSRRRAGLPRPSRADGGEVHRQPLRVGRDRPRPVPFGRRGLPRCRGPDRVPRPDRRPGEDPRLPRGAGRDRVPDPRGARHQPGRRRAPAGRRRRPPRGLPDPGAGPVHRRRRPAPDARRADAALHGARPFRGGRDAPAPDLRQGRPQGAEDRPAHRGRRGRRAGAARQRDRGGPRRGRQADLRQPADRSRGRLLLRSRRPLAPGRPLRLGGARESAARRYHPARRLRPAHRAGDGRRAHRPHGRGWGPGPRRAT
ncbi:hypothetical protein ABIC24_001053 [Methylobacterium radiotolerans]